MNDESMTLIEEEVLRWPGTTSETGRFNAVFFRYGKRTIGHIHRDGMADLPVTKEMREGLLSEGAKSRARLHRAGSKGYVSYPIEKREDVSAVLEILGSNYARAREAAEGVAERRAASRGEEDET